MKKLGVKDGFKRRFWRRKAVISSKQILDFIISTPSVMICFFFFRFCFRQSKIRFLSLVASFCSFVLRHISPLWFGSFFDIWNWTASSKQILDTAAAKSFLFFFLLFPFLVLSWTYLNSLQVKCMIISHESDMVALFSSGFCRKFRIGQLPVSKF